LSLDDSTEGVGESWDNGLLCVQTEGVGESWDDGLLCVQTEGEDLFLVGEDIQNVLVQHGLFAISVDGGIVFGVDGFVFVDQVVQFSVVHLWEDILGVDLREDIHVQVQVLVDQVHVQVLVDQVLVKRVGVHVLGGWENGSLTEKGLKSTWVV
jgi:hypothetical protein